jgi:tetratricopeptide (TPR) repeat protein
VYAGGAQHLLAWAELSFGEPDRALTGLLEHDASLAALGERSFRSTIQAALADAYEQLGHREKARAAVELSDELGGADDVFNVVITHAVRARLARADGDSSAAERWARRAVEHALKTDCPFLQGSSELNLARVLAGLGRRGEATSYARAALELFEAARDRPRIKLAWAVLDELGIDLPMR